MLKRQGVISTWHDRRIMPGQDIDKEVSEYLEKANIILILVSSDFLASDYCYEVEMQRALEKHHTGEAKLIPIILRSCDWQDTPFGKLLAAPTDGKPVTKWPNIDDAFLDIVQAVKRSLPVAQKEQVSQYTKQPAFVAAQAEMRPQIRSSNLAITKEFSESDQASFLHEAFDYIALFFENSVNELQERNPSVSGTFRRIDANRFTSVIYRHGNAVSKCTIFLGGWGDQINTIGYNSSDNGATNSYNQSLTVESDSQHMYFKAGMIFSQTISEKLSFEGAAELFWGRFIEPLQRS